MSKTVCAAALALLVGVVAGLLPHAGVAAAAPQVASLGLPPGVLPPHLRPRPQPPVLKVVSYNIASGNPWKDVPIPFEGLARHILDQSPDVVLLQEVHDQYIDGRREIKDQPRYWRNRLGMFGQYFVTAKAWNLWGQPLGTAGDMILSRYPIVQVDEDKQPFDRGVTLAFGIGATQSPRSKLSVVIDVNGTRVRLASLHQAARTNPQGLLDYMNWMDAFPEPTVLGGDFNREWQALVSGQDWVMRSVFNRYDSAPGNFTRDEDLCHKHNDNIDWILIRRGQMKWLEAGRHGRIGGVCPETEHPDPVWTLSDHPLLAATVAVETVPILNPGFENGFREWSVWSPDPSYRAVALSGGHDGSIAAVQLGGAGFIWRDLSVEPNRDYDIAAWAMCMNGSAIGQLSVHDTAGGAYQITAPACSANVWTQLRLRYRGTATGKVRVHFERTAGSGAVVWDGLEIAPGF